MLLLFTGCEKYETYTDMKEKEQDAINNFLVSSRIQVIDEATFEAQGQTTDIDKNQFVRFDRNGVYMQIVRKVIRNDIRAFITLSGMGTVDVSQYLDKMNVTRNGTTITASFVSGMMYQYHGSASVPGGWLVPLHYINVGYPEKDGDEVAKVRLIVPHSQGTADASSSVEPYYYEVTYQRAL